jgi:predicted RNA binding protein YcfA (HicA-like mRNA interferase family)
LRWLKLHKLKKISGQECIKILCNKLGFKAIRQKGSHVILIKEIGNQKIGTVVPLHKELKLPTLKNILKLAKVNEDEFVTFL